LTEKKQVRIVQSSWPDPRYC